MNENNNRKLILGLAMGMSLEQLRPFFLSLEKSGYRGDVCLLVKNLPLDALLFLRARRVNLVPFKKNFLHPKWAHFAGLAKPFLKPRQRCELEERLTTAYLHVHCARNVYFRDYLADCAGFYEQVMLVDVRDVMFQRDPFDFEMPEGVSVFWEATNVTLGACPFNSIWLLNAFGRGVLEKLSKRLIVCSGTLFGAPPDLLEYLDRIVQLYSTHKTHDSMDQAACNYVVYLWPPEKLHCFDNDAGPVLGKR
jgi:hypothetical protein